MRNRALTDLDKAVVYFAVAVFLVQLAFSLVTRAPTTTSAASDGGTRTDVVDVPSSSSPCYSMGTWLAPGCGQRPDRLGTMPPACRNVSSLPASQVLCKPQD